jgi:choline-glycine betaine transporter
VLWIFFVAGADAGTIVLGSMSTGGPQEPVRWIKLSWGLAMAAIAGVLLVAGGLSALQSASVLTGVPFAFIMVLMCVAFYRHLSDEACGGGQQGRQDLDVAERAKEASAVRPPPGRPAPGQAFTAEERTPGHNTQPGIGEPGMEGQG